LAGGKAGVEEWESDAIGEATKTGSAEGTTKSSLCAWTTLASGMLVLSAISA
jgi:hypothetical protein